MQEPYWTATEKYIMHRNQTEKNRDNLIGEAVLFLLKTHGLVEHHTIAYRLKAMAEEEEDQTRKTALIEAANWIMDKEPEQVTSGHPGQKRDKQNTGEQLAGFSDSQQLKKH